MSNTYEHMPAYISTLYGVFKNIHNKSNEKGDRKLKLISVLIFNYVNHLAKTNNVDLKNVGDNYTINMKYFFEYVNHNNIQLYDFNNINDNDVDISKKEDLERFVLTHVYYITQQ